MKTLRISHILAFVVVIWILYSVYDFVSFIEILSPAEQEYILDQTIPSMGELDSLISFESGSPIVASSDSLGAEESSDFRDDSLYSHYDGEKIRRTIKVANWAVESAIELGKTFLPVILIILTRKYYRNIEINIGKIITIKGNNRD